MQMFPQQRRQPEAGKTKTMTINVPLNAMRLLLLYTNFLHFLLNAADPRRVEFSSQQPFISL